MSSSRTVSGFGTSRPGNVKMLSHPPTLKGDGASRPRFLSLVWLWAQFKRVGFQSDWALGHSLAIGGIASICIAWIRSAPLGEFLRRRRESAELYRAFLRAAGAKLLCTGDTSRR